MLFFFFKQKPAYELRISDWSSDVCSSDLCAAEPIAPCEAQTLHLRIAHRAVLFIRGRQDLRAAVFADHLRHDKARVVLEPFAELTRELGFGFVIDRKSTRLNSSH